jgi:tRNA threonylcarbamoyl adenosine modification protein YjeE
MITTAKTLEETKAFARHFAPNAAIGRHLLLYGDLGAGKTEFAREVIRTLAESVGKADMLGDIPSPTFSLLQLYDLGVAEIAHYDLYRLKSAAELTELDFEESLRDRIVIIEWPELAEPIVKNAIRVKITLAGTARKIKVELPSQEFSMAVDENDNPVGSFIRGGRPQGIYARVAVVVVFRSNGNIVLSRNSRYKSITLLGRLHFTAGGHVDVGEETEHAARREFEEELGIQAPDNMEFMGMVRNPRNSFIHIYKTVYDGGFNPDPREIANIEEFAPHELRTHLATNRNDFNPDLVLALDQLFSS